MLQRLQIRHKLLAVLLVPLVSLAVFPLVRVSGDIRSGTQAARVDRLTAFAGSVTGLIHELQAERDYSLGYIAANRKLGRDGVAHQRDGTDRAVQAFGSDLRAIDLGNDDPPARQRLGDAEELLTRLPAERRAVEAAPPTGVAGTQRYYGDIMAALLDFNAGIASDSNDRQLVRYGSSFVLLSRLKELASRERGLVYALLAAGRVGQGQFEQLVSVIGSQDALSAQFQSSATPEQRRFYTSEVLGANLPKLADLRRAMLSAAGAQRIGAQGFGGPGGIRNALNILSERVDHLRRVELELAGDISATSRARHLAARRAAFVDSFLAVLVLALAVAVSMLLSQSITGPLLKLRNAANVAAERQLPEVVDRLQRGELTRQEAAAAPLDIRSDETGQVARAFNAVYQEAVRVADELAALRASLRGTFLNLARRSQRLIERQLELIEGLKQGAEPEVVERLLGLDHLAARMRRNAESLVVLSGAEAPRRWSYPVPLGQVVRAAMGEVEDTDRVELLPFGDVGLSGEAVADVVHLLAELIENATSFSPPGTKVQIAGQEASNGYVIEVEDRGLGISDEELIEANERLSDPSAVDSALSRMLGLSVVGRLAQRHGIRAQLRHSWYGGVTALVLLPRDLTTSGGLAAPRELAPPARGEVTPLSSFPDGSPVSEAADSTWFDPAAAEHLPLGGGVPAREDRAARPARPDEPAPRPEDPAHPQPAPGRHETIESMNGHGPVAPPERPGPLAPAGSPGPREAPEPADDDTQPFAVPIAGPGETTPTPTPTRTPTPTPTPIPTPTPSAQRPPLPRRVPQANLAPGIPAQPPPPPGESASSVMASRSPEEIRAMLSSYRSGLERGRRVAASTERDTGEWPHSPGTGSGTGPDDLPDPMTPRSTDDPAPS